MLICHFVSVKISFYGFKDIILCWLMKSFGGYKDVIFAALKPFVSLKTVSSGSKGVILQGKTCHYSGLMMLFYDPLVTILRMEDIILKVY